MDFGIGARVVRGPDWKSDASDGGDGLLGVLRGYKGADKAEVQWDNGARGEYEFQQLHELRIYDLPLRQAVHRNTTCDGCKVHEITGLRWACSVCENYDLCSRCYHNDVHSLSHNFKCFLVPEQQNVVDIPTLPPREGSRKVNLYGVLPTSKVVRGVNWSWGLQDNGNSEGVVIDYDNSKAPRDGVQVMWLFNESTNTYFMGTDGRSDLKVVEAPIEDFPVYIDHLPLVDASFRNCKSRVSQAAVTQVRANVSKTSTEERRDSPGTSKSLLQSSSATTAVQDDECCAASRETGGAANSGDKPGDYVRLLSDADAVESLQNGHGGWMEETIEMLGMPGKVLFVDLQGDVCVDFGSQFLTVNRKALEPIEPPVDRFFVNDFVQITDDWDLLMAVQNDLLGFASPFSSMRRILGKVARVVEVSGSLLHLVVESRQFMVNMIAVARCKPPADAIVTGDVVRVVSDTETLRTLQLLHARADDNWALFLGKEGRVTHINESEGARVQLGDVSKVFNIAALKKIRAAADAGCK